MCLLFEKKTNTVIVLLIGRQLTGRNSGAAAETVKCGES